MRLAARQPPRTFRAGRNAREIAHVADLTLEPGELVTATTDDGAELDIARTDWGFYPLPSLNGRLVDRGLRAALVVGDARRFYLLAVEAGRESELDEYLDAEGHAFVAWLSDSEVLERIARSEAR